MELPGHATTKEYRIFLGISAALLLALLVPLYLTGGALPLPVDPPPATATADPPASDSTADPATEPAGASPAEAPAPAAPAEPLPTAVFTVDAYDPARDADADLAATVARATGENKSILLQVGGAWCPWSRAMDIFFVENEATSAALGRDYLVMKVNYSDANENLDFLERFDEIAALPHLLVLDSAGNLVKSQNTEFLEDGYSYDEQSVVAFLEEWAHREAPSPAAAAEAEPEAEPAAASPETESAAEPGAAAPAIAAELAPVADPDGADEDEGSPPADIQAANADGAASGGEPRAP